MHNVKVAYLLIRSVTLIDNSKTRVGLWRSLIRFISDYCCGEYVWPNYFLWNGTMVT